MQQHIGTKMVNAIPMNRAEYNEFRGWQLPANENGADEGYLVEYLDGGQPNTQHYAGYVSWSPKAQFDAAYRPTASMSFGLALEALQQGRRVARSGWNGKGMWLALVSYADYNPVSDAIPAGLEKLPWIGMKTADNCFVPWLASQTDMLAEDWVIAGDAPAKDCADEACEHASNILAAAAAAPVQPLLDEVIHERT